MELHHHGAITVIAAITDGANTHLARSPAFMTTPLHQSIIQHLSENNTLTVHDYMQLALQHPEHGYYRKAQAVGAEGDFITAPEISQIFGDLLGMWFIHAWHVCGTPKKAAFTEFGPGRGTLSADILRIITKNNDTTNVFKLHLLESNETLRKEQAKKLWQHQPIWHDDINSLPTNLPLFIVANEFFDALPIRQYVGNTERCIQLEGEALTFTPQGDVTKEICPAALEIIQQLAAKLQKQGGCMLIIDYGYTENSRQNKDTLQAVKSHHYHPVLQDAGEADITALVDFSAIAACARQYGLQTHGISSQGSFLERLGGEIWLKKLQAANLHHSQKALELQQGWQRLTMPQQMGDLFKVIALTAHPCELAGLHR